MKTPAILVTSILIIIGSFATVQDARAKEPRWKQLSAAYGFVLGQQASLKFIEKKFPDLSRDVQKSSYEFNSSALGESVKGVETELASELRSEWPEVKAKMASQVEKSIESQKITKSQAITFLGEVKMRGKGKLPGSIRSALLSAHPRYSKHPSLEMSEGWSKVFSSEGHAKAKGIKMKISYPSTWKAEEGDRPNILQKFIGHPKAGLNMVTMTTKTLPAPYNRKLTVKEKNEVLAKDVVTEMLPIGTQLSSHMITKIDGELCAMAEATIVTERLGIKIAQKGMIFVIPRDGTLLLIHCAIGADASNGLEELKARYERVKSLYMLIGSSCVFVDKWEE